MITLSLCEQFEASARLHMDYTKVKRVVVADGQRRAGLTTLLVVNNGRRATI